MLPSQIKRLKDSLIERYVNTKSPNAVQYSVYYQTEFGSQLDIAYRGVPTTRPAIEKDFPVVDLGEFTKLAEVRCVDLEEVFQKMQGENWSPNGEARPIIAALGLHHTSMSTGDLIEHKACQCTNYYMVAPAGFVHVRID